MSMSHDGLGLLVKKLIVLEPRGIFGSNFAYLFLHCPAIGMQIGKEATPSIISAIRGILVKMVITLEPHVMY